MLLGLALQPIGAHAQSPSAAAGTLATTEAAPASAPAQKSEVPIQVPVQGRKLSEQDEQRMSSAAVTIIGRGEIEKYGDGSVSGLLAQQPGVTVSGIPGRRGGEVQIRGLSAILMLVNGEPVPPGFTVDMLSPAQIERVEISRVASAERSAQAYAGTINFVLKTKKRSDKDQLTLVAVVPDEVHAQPRVQVLVGGSLLAATVSTLMSAERYDEIGSEYANRTVTTAPSGDVTFDQLDTSATNSRGDELKLMPSLSWSNPFGSTLKADAMILRQSEHRATDYRITQAVGTAPYDEDDGRYDSTFDVNRLSLKGIQPFGEGLGSKVELGVTTNWARWDKEETHRQTGGGADFYNSIEAVNRGLTAKLKYLQALGDDTDFSAGVEHDSNHRDEQWVQTRNGIPYGLEDGAQLNSSETTDALYAQLDAKGKAFSYYVGLRGESLAMRSSGQTLLASRRFSMLSPVAQVSFHLGGEDRNQLRLGLSRGYRLPRVTDLLERTVVSYNNSPFAPDIAGNPDLAPAKVWNVDAALEHYFEEGSLSASVYGKQISDPLISQVVFEDGRWVSRIRNAGHSLIAGIELDAKGKLDKFMSGAPAVELQATASYNWSRVSAVEGSNNRVFGQVPATLSFGATYRTGAWSYSTRWSWNAPYHVRTSDTAIDGFGAVTAGDASVRWAPSPSTRVRLSVANILRQDKRKTLATDMGADGRQLTDQASRSWAVWTLSLTQDF